LAGAQVVIDLANSPSFEDEPVLEFFETSGRNLLPAEAAAGVRHHVALSIVGTDQAPDNGRGSRGLQATAQIDTKEVRSQKSDGLQSPVSDNRNSR
jgi:uncharacterized protein YbjT (DUF2867 family)